MKPITFNKNIPNKEDKLSEPFQKSKVKVANLFFNNGIEHSSSITIKFGDIKSISVVNYEKNEKLKMIFINESIKLTSDVDVEVIISNVINPFDFTINFEYCN